MKFLMKTFLATMLFLAAVSGISYAQKFAYVDSEYILDNIPEYKEAQKKLDEISKAWQKEIEDKYAEIDKMYQSFQAEQILLTDEMKTKRENDIVEKEKAVKALQKQRFGTEGELFKKRQELIKPIQDKVFNTVKALADEGAYACIFDKAGTNILYANSKYDKSDEVLSKMGLGKK